MDLKLPVLWAQLAGLRVEKSKWQCWLASPAGIASHSARCPLRCSPETWLSYEETIPSSSPGKDRKRWSQWEKGKWVKTSNESWLIRQGGSGSVCWHKHWYSQSQESKQRGSDEWRRHWSSHQNGSGSPFYVELSFRFKQSRGLLETAASNNAVNEHYLAFKFSPAKYIHIRCEDESLMSTGLTLEVWCCTFYFFFSPQCSRQSKTSAAALSGNAGQNKPIELCKELKRAGVCARVWACVRMYLHENSPSAKSKRDLRHTCSRDQFLRQTDL